MLDLRDRYISSVVRRQLFPLTLANIISGGYYSGFKDMLKHGKHINIGFPIVEIDSTGGIILTKEKNTGGVVNVGSVISQLLYEIQGPLYYNCDAVADLTDIKIEQLSEDRVLIHGIKGTPPPPTTKVGITAPAGYQAEFHFFMVGLDMEEKCRWTEEQCRYAIGDNIKKFSLLKFHQNGSSPIDAVNQDLATVDFRMFAQSRDREIMRTDVAECFNMWAFHTLLQSAPVRSIVIIIERKSGANIHPQGVSLSNDLRQLQPKPYYEYWVALLPQSSINHRVHCLYLDQKVVDVGCPKITRTYPRQQPSYETKNPVSLDTFGPTVCAPLGYIVLGRSGDKASDCNVGFFVRHDDEWDWLRSVLTVGKIRELLGPQEDSGKPIDRFEMANIRAVHFLLHDHLDRGYNACSNYDTLGKNACEYLRAKTLDIPKKFLDRGRV